jgi:hypothetical protein
VHVGYLTTLHSELSPLRSPCAPTAVHVRLSYTHNRRQQEARTHRPRTQERSEAGELQVASGEHPGPCPGPYQRCNCQSTHTAIAISLLHHHYSSVASPCAATTIAIPAITVPASLAHSVSPVGFHRHLRPRRRDRPPTSRQACAPLVWKPSLAQSPSPTMYIHQSYPLLPAQPLLQQCRILVQMSTTMTTLQTRRTNHRSLSANLQKLSTRTL